MCKHIKTKFLSLAVFGLLLFSGAQSASAASAVASDTIAGYSAEIRVFDMDPDQDVIVQVEKPEGGIIELKGEADRSGAAEVNFVGFHTKNSGVYKVWSTVEGKRRSKVPSTSFEVFPDSVSPLFSRVRAIKDSAAADGEDEVKIVVYLKDRHGNPIPKHYVELISSRSEDKITSSGGTTTDEGGQMLFYVRSESEGISHFTALDRNSGVLPDERAKGIFFSTDDGDERGGDVWRASLFEPQNIFGDDAEADGIFGEEGDKPESFGVVDYFLVELEFPNDNAYVTEAASLTVTAKDDQNRTVRNYTGTILITADDRVSRLPKNGDAIEFEIKDEGSQRFDLGITFTEAGMHTIEVVEFEDGGITGIKGKGEIEVLPECIGDECNEIDNPFPSTGDIVIDRPEKGATYGKRTITFKGSAQEDVDLRVFLDGKEVKLITTDSGGGFFDDTSLRVKEDGEHTLQFEEVELEGKSEIITFYVDTTAPELKEYRISPEGNIKPEEMVTITVFSEEKLDMSEVKIDGTNISKDLNEDENIPGKYTATINAPKEAGEYELDFLLGDAYDNKFIGSGKIVVASEQKELGAPRNLEAIAGDGNAKLTWDTPEETGKGIEKYRILFGTNELLLDQTAATINGEETEQVIEELENDVPVYFGVIAVEEGGLQSKMSNIISVVPKGKKEPIIEEEPVIVNTENTVEIIPGNGEMSLRWDAPKSFAEYFDIRFGLSAGAYSERFAVLGTSRNAVIPDLINGVAYYVTVVPLDRNGIPTGEKYQERYAMPAFSGVHNVATTFQPSPELKETKQLSKEGPEAIFISLLALSFSFGMFFLHRSARIYRIPV